MKRLGKKSIVTLAIVLGAVCLGLVCAGLFLEFVKVPTGAMKNTILPGEKLVANRITGEINRGDIVIFNFFPDPRTRFVSRIIGLPGETFFFQSKTKSVLIND